ncbi:LexA family protein [Selenomonas sp. F0473]|uniref:LexA family protein n=1 Tax=Selenomonas sp. F0473 TaxID=999423 RepID=UPI0025D6F5AC|nr:LexA family transcriptional regulator [Selenomonas sp. F0473]
MSIGSRIKARRKSLGLSVDDIAERLGKNRATVYRYESDDIENLPSTVLEPLAKALRTTPAHLMGWKDKTAFDIFNIPNVEPIRTQRVPLIGTIAAGIPILADENFDGYVELHEDVHADFCLRIRGDSMIGARIYDGDIVFIRHQPDVENGEIAAVLLEDEATLKRVYKQQKGIILQAENPNYAPIIVNEHTCVNCRIIGKAVAFLSDVV